MNKIIFTNDRLFMALVGPGGSGKTRLIYSMLASHTTFYPPIEKTFHFYKQYQPLFQEMSEKLNIEFIPCLDFEMIKNLENCLLVFDDSCGRFTKNKYWSNLQLPVDIGNSIAFSSNTIYSIKASGRAQLI